MKTNTHIAGLIKEYPVLDKETLFHFFRQDNKDLSETAMSKRIADLKRKGLIMNVGRGRYIATEKSKPIFKISPDDVTLNLTKKIRKKFPYASFTVWNTRFLNNFMIHQAFHNPVIIEAEKEAVDSMFSFLQDNKLNVFNNPSAEIIDKYVLNSKENIIIKRLITESPLHKNKNTLTPKIEKILVDLYADAHIFNTYQGSELKNIFENVYNRCQINWTTLFSYASRRHKKEELIEFVKTIPSIPQNLIDAEA